jgi:hypothetical protein
MTSDFDAAFATLKPVLGKYAKRLSVKTDKSAEYTLVSRGPSPFPQHKGQPMWFGSLRLGKAYVSFHLMPLYMNPALTKKIPPVLAKRMQGKTCFNFKDEPAPEVLSELERLTAAAVEDWAKKEWV